MNLCRFCDSFTPTIQGMCKSCTEEYVTIRSFIENHPNSNMMHIATSTTIPLRKIKLFVERGNFVLKD